MTEKNFEMILENEKEWRRYMVKRIDSLEADMQELRKGQAEMNLITNTLKVKLGLIATVFSASSGAMVSYFMGRQ